MYRIVTMALCMGIVCVASDSCCVEDGNGTPQPSDTPTFETPTAGETETPDFETPTYSPDTEPFEVRNVVGIADDNNLIITGEAAKIKDIEVLLCCWVGDIDFPWCSFSCESGLFDPIDLNTWYPFKFSFLAASLCDLEHPVATFCAVGPDYDSCGI